MESYAAERVTITCKAAREALLVLVEAYGRGWSATVDGHGAEIVRTNVLIRGVYLAPGEHRVVFSYRTPGLREGLALCVLGLLLCLAILKRPKPQSPNRPNRQDAL